MRAGHPWIYRSDVAAVEAQPGDVVRVLGVKDRPLGSALFSDQSQITLRMLARDERAIDEAFWKARLRQAIQFRGALQLDATGFRLVHGEADLLPSLVVDQYGEVLVVQALSQGMDRLLGTVGQMAAIKPEVLDKIDFDQVVDDMGEAFGVNPALIVSDEDVAALRQARAQAQQAAQSAATAPQVVDSAKTASEIDTDQLRDVMGMLQGYSSPSPAMVQ